MLSESSQRAIKEGVAAMLPRVEQMQKAARSGGPNLENYIKTRCEQITKLLREIEDKA